MAKEGEIWELNTLGHLDGDNLLDFGYIMSISEHHIFIQEPKTKRTQLLPRNRFFRYYQKKGDRTVVEAKVLFIDGELFAPLAINTTILEKIVEITSD